MQTIFLCADEYADGKAVHRSLKTLLALPDYYGGNADALYDCLSERAEPIHLWIAGRGGDAAEDALRKVSAVVEDLGGEARRV